MSDFNRKLENYASLAVHKGVNLQEGQTLVINAPLDAADFVRLTARKAYEGGAKNVHVEWNDDALTRLKYDLAPDEAFEEYPHWKARGFEEMAEAGAAFMTIKSTDPDLLKGVDPERVATANKTAGAAMETFRSYIQSDKTSWLVVSAPSEAWAKKVFPEAGERAVDELWEAIFKAVRADLEDPVAAWEAHDDVLQEKARFLEEQSLAALHFKAPGTDLKIDLPEGHLWVGGGGKNQDGVHFIANMPTEEVFTVPHKDGVNGQVTNTKPLNYGGNLIDNFTLTFENGVVVDYSAETGEETLKHLLETDENAKRLGEVALVPHSSPISQTGILFYNTLYDENASCHIALGSAYAFCLEGGSELSKEEKEEAGLNQSLVHVDFMIGSEHMDIDGIKADGSTVAVFRNGEWAD
ncbi:aminopeptidase II [Salsuginibacillus halophilus]|uniref:Aminopeptidase II n=1 Tax=Salsuginibacillus halophilus TaxID=517424 RepID=A0A2P8HG77_9BACI|nr:aminopeptidase [Salsuginibacillus halophilus]PSL45190.1 aminopeptidase II [Salsuginibacillus halophilus]